MLQRKGEFILFAIQKVAFYMSARHRAGKMVCNSAYEIIFVASPRLLGDILTVKEVDCVAVVLTNT